ncbi:NUDIX hydrolase [Bifidobacterium xylocopae]
MTTPTDLARMLSRHAKDRGDHVGKGQRHALPSLSHTPGEDMEPSLGRLIARLRLDRDGHGNDNLDASADEADGGSSDQLISVSIREHSASGKVDGAGPGAPTPAVMPRHKDSERGSFASLQTQDLPVVREYSAGGLIFDSDHRVAIIARHSRSGHLEWCLPKGHIEKGETPEQTAVREVHEETGILGQVVGSIATIDYWFTGSDHRVHKLVHHFVLEQTGGSLTVEGDPDHEAEDAAWVRFEDLTDVLSYPNERKIAWLYARKIQRTHE